MSKVRLSAEADMGNGLSITPDPLVFDDYPVAIDAAREWAGRAFWPAKANPKSVIFKLEVLDQ